jgi:hypothetical protein
MTASGQSQGQPAAGIHDIVLEFSIIETTGAQPNEIARVEKNKDQVIQLIADGKARIVAVLQMRTRTGEGFTARLGERIPIHTGTLPAFRTSDRTSPDASALPQALAARAGIPQIAYENTGVIIEGTSTAAGEGLLDIRLKLEMTGIDHSTGRLTPTFTKRIFTDVVRMKESETAMLLGFVQAEDPKLSIEQIASGVSIPTRQGLVLLLTTKPVR